MRQNTYKPKFKTNEKYNKKKNNYKYKERSVTFSDIEKGNLHGINEGRKKKQKNEFKKHKYRGHWNYSYKQIDNDELNFSITHGSRTDGIDNLPLITNPDSTDSDPAYVVKRVYRDRKEDFKSKREDLHLSKKDKKQLEKYMI